MFSGHLGKGVSLQRLSTLCLVSEAGGVMKAADGDPNRQSQYSRQLRELEEALSISLVDRSSSPHRLTPAGIEIEHVTRKFFSEFDRVIKAHTGKGPIVRFGAGESIIQWLLLPVLTQRPLNDVVFRFHNQRSRIAVDAVRNGRLDLAVVGLPDLPEDLGYERIASYGMILVARHDCFKKKRVSWRELSSKRLAVLEGAKLLHQKIEELGKGFTDPPTLGIECTSYPQVIEAALHGDFIGVVPRIIETASLHPELTLWDVSELANIVTDLHLIWHPESYAERPEIRATVEFLIRRKSARSS